MEHSYNADRNAGSSIEQEIRHLGRQNQRLFQRAIEIGLPVGSALTQFIEKCKGRLGGMKGVRVVRPKNTSIVMVDDSSLLIAKAA